MVEVGLSYCLIVGIHAIGIYGFHELKLRPFLNTPIRPGIIRSGTKLSLLTKTLTGTLVELRRLSTYDFILTTSTGTVELRFLKLGCLPIRQHDNRPLPQRTAEGSVDGLLTVANITDPKMQGRDSSKNLAKKSQFALSRSLSRLFLLTYFVKYRRTLLELNSQGQIQFQKER